ncbi:hypothetical protein MKQ68_19755 [Chitinophaga horti]|uniref:Uncharacterized protein n=1 Tax=Chitinophaga horti TaxID=2920382 RepID=A0ABY6J202_9BACT|nr:hypothetical protein [Chitinophaga horti]UYQ92324.1 hypothetical protein MKQ68_19755 [Chitinophaga horti]
MATMKVVIFLMCMCYLLLGGYNYIHKGDHPSRYAIADNIDKSFQQKFNTRQEHKSTLSETRPAQTDNYLENESVEDEETGSNLARKYRLLACIYLMLAGLFVTASPQQRLKAHWPFFSLLSDKYITQRVLRL